MYLHSYKVYVKGRVLCNQTGSESMLGLLSNGLPSLANLLRLWNVGVCFALTTLLFRYMDGLHFMGVLRTRALLFWGVYKGPQFLEIFRQ